MLLITDKQRVPIIHYEAIASPFAQHQAGQLIQAKASRMVS